MQTHHGAAACWSPAGGQLVPAWWSVRLSTRSSGSQASPSSSLPGTVSWFLPDSQFACLPDPLVAKPAHPPAYQVQSAGSCLLVCWLSPKTSLTQACRKRLYLKKPSSSIPLLGNYVPDLGAIDPVCPRHSEWAGGSTHSPGPAWGRTLPIRHIIIKLGTIVYLLLLTCWHFSFESFSNRRFKFEFIVLQHFSIQLIFWNSCAIHFVLFLKPLESTLGKLSQVNINKIMEEPGELWTVVFALFDSHCVFSRFRNNLCKDDSALFSRLLHVK